MTDYVTFVTDDQFGLWAKGERAIDLGPESDHPDAPPMRLLELRGEVIALYSPFARGLIERVA
jgi:hypothetical protein